MKLKDLHPQTSLKSVYLKMPEEVYNASSLAFYNIDKDTPIMYHGFLMGDHFVKIKQKEDQIYPLFNAFFNIKDLLEWEVVSA
jgi:hypothetical protein